MTKLSRLRLGVKYLNDSANPPITEVLQDPSTESVAHLASPLALRSRIQPTFRHRPQQKLISDAILDAVTGRGPRFIAVSVPQQFGKSEITSVGTPEWWIELHSLGAVPGGLVALVSYEDELAMNFSTAVRREMAARPEVFTATLRKDSKAKGFWETEEGGGIIAVGVGGSIVGRPVSLFVIDDPIKNFEQATSERYRDALWNWWLTVAIGRLQPWTIVLVVMTRWAADDFIGRLLSDEYEGDPADWRYIRIPYVADSSDDPLGRPIGDPLIRPQTDQTIEEARTEAEFIQKSVSTYAWNTMWQMNPVDPEGTIFFESKWRYWGGDSGVALPDRFDSVVMSWDMAFKEERQHDWVVGEAWSGIDADRFLIDEIRGHWGFTDTIERVKSFAASIRRRYPNATAILVEDKANGPAVINALSSRVGGLVAITPEGSKESRAWAVQPLLLGGNLYIPAPSVAGWSNDYRKELADFPRGSKDDRVDATTQALLYMQQFTVQPSSVIIPSGMLPSSPRTR